MAMTDKELIQEIRKCRLADLSDGMDALGLVNAGSMSPGNAADSSRHFVCGVCQDREAGADAKKGFSGVQDPGGIFESQRGVVFERVPV